MWQMGGERENRPQIVSTISSLESKEKIAALLFTAFSPLPRILEPIITLDNHKLSFSLLALATKPCHGWGENEALSPYLHCDGMFNAPQKVGLDGGLLRENRLAIGRMGVDQTA